MDAARVATLRVGTSTYLFTEDDAITMLDEFRRAFGWAAVAFTRRDVEHAHGYPVSDAGWGRVRRTHAWSEIVAAMCDAGTDLMSEAMEAARISSIMDEFAEDFLLNHDARNP